MNTPTHLLVGLGLLARSGKPGRNLMAAAGSFLPDLSIYALVIYAGLIADIPSSTVWRVTYWQEPWQTLSAISNSVPLYGALLLAGLWLRRELIIVFALAALLHMALDFPFHAEDAHKHFWPLSDWRYHSPLSYWDTSRCAAIVSAAEKGIAIALMVALLMRFKANWVRVGVTFGLASYVVVPLYFALTLGPSNRTTSCQLAANAPSISATMASAAAAGSGAWVIGRPTTR